MALTETARKEKAHNRGTLVLSAAHSTKNTVFSVPCLSADF